MNTRRLAQAAFMMLILNLANAARAEGTAGLFVEPGVTYQAYDSSTNWPAPLSDSSGEVRGFGVMARLGFHVNEVLFVAADGRYAMPNYKDSSNSLDAKAKEWDLGPSVGIQMPNVGLRVWGTYIAASQLDPDESNGFNFKYTDGTGWRIGAGFRVAIVSLNLEYQKLKYDKTTIEKALLFTGGDASDVDYNGEGWSPA